MAAHRHGTFGQHFHRFAQPAAAFQLHHVSTGLHQLGGIGTGRLWRGVTHKRHIGQQQTGWRAAADGASMIGNVGDGDRQRGVVALQRHPQRVAYQQHFNALLFKQFGKAGIVGGEGSKLALFLLPLAQMGHGGGFHHYVS